MIYNHNVFKSFCSLITVYSSFYYSLISDCNCQQKVHLSDIFPRLMQVDHVVLLAFTGCVMTIVL